MDCAQWGIFQSKKLPEGVPGSKKFTSQTPIFFRNYYVSEVNRRCATTRSRDMANGAPVHSREFSKKNFITTMHQKGTWFIWKSFTLPKIFCTGITVQAKMGQAPFAEKQRSTDIKFAIEFNFHEQKFDHFAQK